MADKPILLVTGAGGQLGSRVVELLLESDAGSVVATTRDPSKLGRFAERGVDVRKADFDDPASLRAAFEGAERLLLISTDALYPPRHRITQHRAAIDAAQTVGVKHVVYTSAVGPFPEPGGSVVDDHFWTEHALVSSKMSWTILRHHVYTEMLLLSLPQAVASGQIFSATGGGGRSYVTREDCARTDAAALASASTECRVYDVNGPAAVTQDELAAMVSDVTGRHVVHVGLEPEALRQGMVQAGLPAFVADAMVVFDVAARHGYHAVVAPTVKELTGREPTSVREFLEQHQAALMPGE